MQLRFDIQNSYQRFGSWFCELSAPDNRTATLIHAKYLSPVRANFFPIEFTLQGNRLILRAPTYEKLVGVADILNDALSQTAIP